MRPIGPRFARKKGGLKSFLGVRVGGRVSHVKWSVLKFRGVAKSGVRFK